MIVGKFISDIPLSAPNAVPCRNCKQQGSFIARKEDRHHSGHGTIVKSKGSLMPLLGRFLKKGTDNVKEVGVQPPVEDQRPSSD